MFYHKNLIAALTLSLMLLLMPSMWYISVSGTEIKQVVANLDSVSENTISDNSISQNSLSNINEVSFNLVWSKIRINGTLQSEITDYFVEYKLQKAELEEDLDSLDQIEDTLEWFLRYKELREKYEFMCDDFPLYITDEYSEEEIYYIEKMVETETHGCSFEAKVNVANVVFNRVEHHKFPDSPKAVITSPGQFCYGKSDITEETKLAIEYAFLFPDTTNGALYFHSGRKTATFSGKPLVYEDDAVHYFYG